MNKNLWNYNKSNLRIRNNYHKITKNFAKFFLMKEHNIIYYITEF